MISQRSLLRLARAVRIVFGRRWRTFVRADELSPLILGLIIGVISGVLVVAVKLIVQAIHEAVFDLPPGASLSAQPGLSSARVVLAPMIGGLVVGLFIWASRRVRKRDPVDPIEANALFGGRMSAIDSLLVLIGTILSSGCGASVGLEAGYTQACSGFASRLGRGLRLRRADLRTLVGCGAAAAIAAAFNAPLAGAFYAFELVLGAYSVTALAPVLLAALVGKLVDQTLLAHGSGLATPASLAFAITDYLVFIVMGLVAGALGIVMMKFATSIEVVMQRGRVPRYLRPAMGGLAVGALALGSPSVLGAGHGVLHEFLVFPHDIWLLALLVLLKTAAAAISVGSGFRGGLFYTSLFVGVLYGSLSGEIYQLLAPGLASERVVYVLVGMGSVAAAVIGAPMTMIFLVLELTGDLSIAAGVMAAVVAATVLVRRTFGYSFSTWRLHLRGETIRSALDVGWARELTVIKLMRREARTTNETMTVAAFRKRFPIGSSERVFLQDEEGHYAGFVMVSDVHAPENDATGETRTVRELRQAPASFLLPRQNIVKVLETFEAAEIETLPVVDDPQSLRVLGYVTEAYALKRYSQELERRRREYAGERS